MKKIIVTGASSGIGRAISKLLVEQGNEVYGVCRRADEVDAGVIGIACDLTDATAIRRVFSELPIVDVLVNNAGVALLSQITTGRLEDWDKMWSVNVRALALCSQLVLEKFNQSGQIINVSSMSGHRVPPGGGFYSPTKFAVRAITEALRLELRAMSSPVRVASVSPGFVDTPILDDYFKGREAVLKQTKQNMKMLDSTDVAEVVLSIINTSLHVEVGDVQLRSVQQDV